MVGAAPVYLIVCLFIGREKREREAPQGVVGVVMIQRIGWLWKVWETARFPGVRLWSTVNKRISVTRPHQFEKKERHD